VAVIGFVGIPALAQYEDLVDLPDAPTRTQAQTEQGVICTLEGVQFIQKAGEKGGNDMSLVFLLTEKPSAYFNYYDASKKAVVFDFYDTHIGESPIDAIHAGPILNSTIESSKIDLNKDVEGLKPDIRDVVRVSLFSQYDFEYDVQEDESVITMNFKWSNNVEKKLKSKKNAFYWEFPLGLAVAGGAGYGAYLYLKPKPTTVTDPLAVLPPHPAP
jgi:hypothetical protein